MNDLFRREQQIYDEAVKHLSELQDSTLCNAEVLQKVITEYGRILRQLRRITRMSDKTAGNLNTSRQNLLDKVHYDTLTGIFNRRFLDENLDTLMESAAQSGEPIGILMIDVDFFKQYNDTYGHGAGDECLKKVAAALKGSLFRTDDFVVRYGGEEFVMVLPHTDEAGVHAMSARLLKSVRDCNIVHEKNIPVGYITVSIGSTIIHADAKNNFFNHINRADKALYLSKQNGRNQYTFVKLKGDS